jgi:hypothetical protein
MVPASQFHGKDFRYKPGVIDHMLERTMLEAVGTVNILDQGSAKTSRAVRAMAARRQPLDVVAIVKVHGVENESGAKSARIPAMVLGMEALI